MRLASGRAGDVVLDEHAVFEHGDLDAAELRAHHHDAVDALATREELGLGDDRTTTTGVASVTAALLLGLEAGRALDALRLGDRRRLLARLTHAHRRCWGRPRPRAAPRRNGGGCGGGRPSRSAPTRRMRGARLARRQASAGRAPEEHGGRRCGRRTRRLDRRRRCLRRPSACGHPSAPSARFSATASGAARRQPSRPSCRPAPSWRAWPSPRRQPSRPRRRSLRPVAPPLACAAALFGRRSWRSARRRDARFAG